MFTMAKYEKRGEIPELVKVKDAADLWDKIDLFLRGRLLDPQQRSSVEESPWMNRYPIGKGYVLIPKDLEHPDDIITTTDSRFVIVRNVDGSWVTIGKNNIPEINAILERITSPEGSKEFEKEKAKKCFLTFIFQTYRRVYSPVEDDYIAMLAIQNDISRCGGWLEKMGIAHGNGITDCDEEEEMRLCMSLIVPVFGKKEEKEET